MNLCNHYNQNYIIKSSVHGCRPVRFVKFILTFALRGEKINCVSDRISEKNKKTKSKRIIKNEGALKSSFLIARIG